MATTLSTAYFPTHDFDLPLKAIRRRRRGSKQPRVVSTSSERSTSRWVERGPEIIENEPLNFALQRIERIEEISSIEPGAKAKLISSLRASLTGDSIFPSITTDGWDGLAAQWIAGRQRLMIEFDSEGQFSFIVTDTAGTLIRNEVGQGRPDLSELRRAIAEFSRAVSARNPRWRSNFA